MVRTTSTQKEGARLAVLEGDEWQWRCVGVCLWLGNFFHECRTWDTVNNPNVIQKVLKELLMWSVPPFICKNLIEELNILHAILYRESKFMKTSNLAHIGKIQE